MILLLVAILLLPSPCTCCMDGAPCNSGSVMDGTCVHGTCMSSIPSAPRENLTLSIVVKYPETVLKTHGGSQLYIRGNGLGLRRDTGTVLPKIDTDTWRLTIVYTSSPAGYQCQACADKQLIVDKLEYRILVDDRLDMVGSNFAIDFPVSKASSYFTKKAERTVYPWFYQRTGKIDFTTVRSNGSVGDRNITIYTPPSFQENTYKMYPTVFIIDFHPLNFEIPLHVMDDLMTRYAVIEEFVAIGMGDYNEDERMQLLLPTRHDYVECINGTLIDNCDGCFSESVYENISDWFNVMATRCGRLTPTGGGADSVIDFLLGHAFPSVDAKLVHRLSKNSRDVGIMGYSLGGLFSCYAAWTRPLDFGFAACQSSSFWWPISVHNSSVTFQFEFIEVILRNTTGASRPPQKFYLDAGDKEQEWAVQMAGAAVKAADRISLVPGYALDQNVWVSIYPGATHSFSEWQLRLWKAFKIIVPTRGNPTLSIIETTSSVSSLQISVFENCLVLCMVLFVNQIITKQ